MCESRDFKNCFFILALFFLVYFYIAPLVVLCFYSDVAGFYGLMLHEGEVYFCFLSLMVFLLGFIPVHYFSFKVGFVKRRSFSNNYQSNFFTAVFFVFLVVYLCFAISDTERVSQLYAVRKGEADGSHFQLLLSIIVSALSLTVVVTLYGQKKRMSSIFLTFLFVIYLIGESVGRTNLLLVLMLLLMNVLSLRAVKGAKLILIAMAFAIPVISSLKSIIYSISVSRTLSADYSSYFAFDLKSYFDSFGHVLLSFINRDVLVDVCSYRYFYDLIQGFLFYLKVFGFDFGESITYCNTMALLGVKESIVPPGYFAFGFVQLGLLGVFFSGVLYALVGKMARFVYVQTSRGNELAKFLIAFWAANTFYHGDLRVMVLTFFIPLFVFCVFQVTNNRLCLKTRG